MNCRRVCSLVSALIDGELTGAESLRLRRHLEECRSCREEYESLLHTKRLLSSTRIVEPRSGLESEIMKRLSTTPDPPAWQRRFVSAWLVSGPRRRLHAAGGLAAVSLIVLALSVRFTLLSDYGSIDRAGPETSLANARVTGSTSEGQLPYPDIGFAHETFERPQPVANRSDGLRREPTDGPQLEPLPAWQTYRPVSSAP